MRVNVYAYALIMTDALAPSDVSRLLHMFSINIRMSHVVDYKSISVICVGVTRDVLKHSALHDYGIACRGI